MTEKTNKSEADNKPSLTLIDMFTSPLKLGAGVKVSCSLSTVADTENSLLLTAVNVRRSPSTSFPDNKIVFGVSSGVSVSSTSVIVGGSLTANTTISVVSDCSPP